MLFSVKSSEVFDKQLDALLDIIEEDKPSAAISFLDNLEDAINLIAQNPKICRKSIYSDKEIVRDLIFKGYTITYYINKVEKSIILLVIFKGLSQQKASSDIGKLLENI